MPEQLMAPYSQRGQELLGADLTEQRKDDEKLFCIYKTSRPFSVSESVGQRKGGRFMTLFAFIKWCLSKEAARTEPDCTKLLQRVLKPPEKGQDGKQRPP